MHSNKKMVLSMLIMMGLTGLLALVEVGALSGCSPRCLRNSDCGSGLSCLGGGLCGIGDAGLAVDFSEVEDLATQRDAQAPPDAAADGSPGG